MIHMYIICICLCMKYTIAHGRCCIHIYYMHNAQYSPFSRTFIFETQSKRIRRPVINVLHYNSSPFTVYKTFIPSLYICICVDNNYAFSLI